MGKFTDNIINQRFTTLYKHLISNKIVSTKTDLANQLNTYNHVVNSILNGDRSLTTNQINNLCHHFDVNANYLFGTSEKMFENGTITNIPLTKDIGLVTLLSNEELLEPDSWKLNKRSFSLPGINEQHFAFRQQGDSMFPTLSHGDMLIFKPEALSALRNNLIYLIITETIFVKRVQKIQNKSKLESVRMISDNTIYPPFEIEASEIKKIGRIKSRWSKQGLK